MKAVPRKVLWLIDKVFRWLIGMPEPTHYTYTLPAVTNHHELDAWLVRDFFERQPNRLQLALLDGYTFSRHQTGLLARKLYGELLHLRGGSARRLRG